MRGRMPHRVTRARTHTFTRIVQWRRPTVLGAVLLFLPLFLFRITILIAAKVPTDDLSELRCSIVDETFTHRRSVFTKVRARFVLSVNSNPR